MGCRLVTPNDAVEPTEQEKAEPRRLTDRPSSLEDLEPEAEEEAQATAAKQEDTPPCRDALDLPTSSSSSLSVVPPTITSQISDIVDLCEEMEVEGVRLKSEAIHERILRAQYQVEQLGDQAALETVELLSEVYARFEEIAVRYASKQETADATVDALEQVDARLELVTGQLAES
ncbi:uncharacterized protein IUM83_02521 [Phytophthora cinnamomi]|uniref:uncharacterized protein n=1 Tax=Phytophthora cinnamomi TaxID=4785 RepID=UPI00355A43EB|nr:hypothetical protein IUM83_02521 [Phytophthora cinnamomi]